ncbi:MAG: hypothetical protein NZ923_10845 [Candidatus Kryptonium sp.]|nr:hypothetical protein [Candidatus Kryptonium sp.]
MRFKPEMLLGREKTFSLFQSLTGAIQTIVSIKPLFWDKMFQSLTGAIQTFYRTCLIFFVPFVSIPHRCDSN